MRFVMSSRAGDAGADVRAVETLLPEQLDAEEDVDDVELELQVWFVLGLLVGGSLPAVAEGLLKPLNMNAVGINSSAGNA